MTKDWRIYAVILAVLLFAGGIVARMFYLQVSKGGYYAALARGQHVQYLDFLPPRGNIFIQDKFHQSSSPEDGLFLVATNKEWPLVFAVPKEVTDPSALASALMPIIGEYASSTEREFYERLKNKDDSYELLARRISPEMVSALEGFDSPGLYVRNETLRHYPAGELAAHTLGFVGYRGDERVGQYGVEGFYDDVLRGKKSAVAVPFLFGKNESREFLKRGKSLVLSIDYNIQFMFEEKLKTAKEFLDAEGASGVVMDPKTGEILALAAINAFDPNNYSSVESIDIFLNDIIQKMFEPGSVFKPFTMAAALDAGRILPSTAYTDNGSVKVWDRTFRNSDGKAHGRKTMTEALELSLNTGMIFAEQELGHEKFREYMQRFGFGEITGVDLQGEVAGDTRNIMETKRDVNFATASFGQGIAATPIQLLVGFSAFANGGKMVRPHVVKEVINEDGTRTPIETEIIGSPISSKIAAQMTAMLVSVVENGYGKKARVPGYKVAGKTGTAQVPDKERGGYYEHKTIHSFIGFAPAYNPRFIALLKVDAPKNINFSADSVAPLFSKVAEYILNYYEIPPDN